MTRLLVCFLTIALSFGAHAQTPATNLLVKDGQTVAFMGDSITGMGWSVPGGYVHLVVDGLAANGVKITPIPAGVGGDTSTRMLARVDKDVISKKPDWLTLSCGVNDVWGRGVDLDTFKKQMTEIVDKVQAAKIKIMILTPSPIYEASKQEFNDKLPAYVDFLKQLAQERHLPCADIHQAWLDFIAAKNEPKDPNVVTVDGVHPNPYGHMLFAKTILATFGATPDQIATAEKAWRAEPIDAALPTGFALRAKVPVSAEELAALNKLAADQKIDMKRLLHTVALQCTLDALKGADLEKIYAGDLAKPFGEEAKKKLDAMTNTPAGASGAEPQEVTAWFSGAPTMSLEEWDAIAKAGEARQTGVTRLATATLMEVIRDYLANQTDMSHFWSDDVTNKIAPAFKARIDEIAQKEGGWTPPATAKP